MYSSLAYNLCLYLGSLWALCTRYCKLSGRIFLETRLLGDHGEVRAREAQHKRRPFSLVENIWIDLDRLEDRLSVGVKDELQGDEIPMQ